MPRMMVLSMVVVASLFSFGFSQKRRAKVKPKPKPKIVARPITLNIISSAEMICNSGQCLNREATVKLVADSSNPNGDPSIVFVWNVTGGKLNSTGKSVSWDLKGVLPGVYTATVKASDQHSGKGDAQKQVSVIDCGPCTQNSTPCPTISVACPSEVDKSTVLKFSATVAGGPLLSTPATYLWTNSAGRIVNGIKGPEMEVALPEDEDEVRGTVFIGGYDPRCSTIASCTSKIKR